MTQVVVAVYKEGLGAKAAVDDLKVARVPSVTIRQFVSAPTHEGRFVEIRDRDGMSGDRIVAVTVDDRHASAVTELLGMQSPLNVTEAPLHVR